MLLMKVYVIFAKRYLEFLVDGRGFLCYNNYVCEIRPKYPLRRVRSIAMKHCFILNPYAGKGQSIPELKEQIERVCAERGADYEIYMTEGVGAATEYVKRKMLEVSDDRCRFYACGGDGTLSEVVNGVMESDPKRAAVGLIPSGTGNDFARNFTEPELFFDMAAQLDSSELLIDVMRCNDRYAINMVNTGFDCEVVVKTAELKRKAWVPLKMAYIAGLVATLLKKPGVAVKTLRRGEEQVENKQYLLVTCGKGCYYGGGFHSNPKANLTDGELDCLLVNDMSRARFVMLVGDYKKGTHLTPKFEKILTHKKVDGIDVVFDHGANVSVDGEVIRYDELHVSLVPAGLCFLVPKGSAYRKENVREKEEALV